MNLAQIWFRHAVLLSVLLTLTACGGGEGDGGSFSETVNASSVTNPDDPNVASRMMTFSEDIEPIMLGKCIGCHVRGAGALAPRSLEGIDRVNSFKSAIQHALENCSMAPEGLMQLSKGEYSEFMAWLNGVPYTSSGGLVRVSFIEAQAWDTTPKVRDVFRSYRPEDVQCAQGTGWLVEDDASCDSAPGAGDGSCDACAITAGITSDDEMFVLLGATLLGYEAEMSPPSHPTAWFMSCPALASLLILGSQHAHQYTTSTATNASRAHSARRPWEPPDYRQDRGPRQR